MKTCVYTICKNEEKFIKRWYESIKDSDYICVLDTGSTDNSINILKSLGINVKKEIIEPFRFDVARNKSLEMIPEDADICICLDIDEVIEQNWKEKLTNLWSKDITRLSYIYNWKLDENNKPKISFYANKIHLNKSYIWSHPVHEVLKYIGKDKEKIYKTNDIVINHYPDSTKSRNSYLPLLELSVKENPFDDRNMHYLGREYMYYKKWNECIDTLIKHLNLPNATWKDERCASMRFISKSYLNLNRIDEAKYWIIKAINEAPYLREPYVDKMLIHYYLKEYNLAIIEGIKALNITTNNKTYINEIYAWDETIYDVISICYYYLNNKQIGLKFLELALLINPNNERIKENKKFFE